MRIFILCCCAILAFSCSRQEGQADRAAVEQEVRTTLQAYFDDIRTGGLILEFRYLDDSDDFFWVPPGYESALSYDSVRTILTQGATVTRSADFSWEELRVVPISEGAAAYTGIVRGVMVDTSGTTTRTRMLETGVVIKRNDGWKLLCGQTRMF